MVGALREVLVESRLDVLHCHFRLVSPVAVAAAHVGLRLGLPTVMTLHSCLGIHTWWITALDRLLGCSRWPLAFTAVSEKVASGGKKQGAPPGGA